MDSGRTPYLQVYEVCDQNATNLNEETVTIVGSPREAVREGGVEVLHHKHWQLGTILKVDPEEMYHTRVVQAAQQLAFFRKPLQHGYPLLEGGRIEQELVDLLAHAFEATKLKPYDSGIRSISNYLPSITHSMELKLSQGVSSWAALGKTCSHSLLSNYSYRLHCHTKA